MSGFNQDLLYEHLFYCRLPEYKHLCSEFPRSVDWMYYKKTPPDDFWFAGFHFVKGEVYAYNILIYSDTNWDSPEFLNLTEAFVELQEQYNVFHVVLIAQMVMRRFYRESVFVESHYLIFKHHNNNQPKKKQYAAQKHRDRQGKYINSEGNQVQGLWNRNLVYSAKNEVFTISLSKFRNKRFDSHDFLWDARNAISCTSHKLQRASDLLRQQKAANKRRTPKQHP